MQSTDRRKGGRRAVYVVIIIVGLLAAACGSSDKGASPSTPSTTATAPSTSAAPSAPSRFNVYLIAKEHIAAAGREQPGSSNPERAVRALLAGPQGEIEKDLGLTTAIPDGTRLLAVTVGDHAATVDLSQEFVSGGGSLSMQERAAQVVFTVTQFPNVDRVRFRIDGAAVSTIGGEGLMVDNVDRASFANVTPAILVESPTPGEVVRSPLHARGMSNTFEATVNYSLADASGRSLAEGYTTATAGTGTWGTFTVDIPFVSTHPGLGRLSLYEISPKDGSHVNEMPVPVQMP